MLCFVWNNYVWILAMVLLSQLLLLEILLPSYFASGLSHLANLLLMMFHGSFCVCCSWHLSSCLEKHCIWYEIVMQVLFTSRSVGASLGPPSQFQVLTLSWSIWQSILSIPRRSQGLSSIPIRPDTSSLTLDAARYEFLAIVFRACHIQPKKVSSTLFAGENDMHIWPWYHSHLPG